MAKMSESLKNPCFLPVGASRGVRFYVLVCDPKSVVIKIELESKNSCKSLVEIFYFLIIFAKLLQEFLFLGRIYSTK